MENRTSQFRHAADNAADRRAALLASFWILLSAGAVIALIFIFGCSPLIQTGGSVSVATMAARPTPGTNGGQSAQSDRGAAFVVASAQATAINAGDRAAISSKPTNTDSKPPSDFWRRVALWLGIIGAVVAFVYFVLAPENILRRGLLRILGA